MDVATDEIADGVIRFSVFVPEVAPPAGFTFNHFLIRAEQPMLFHTGSRRMFPLIAEAMAKVMPLQDLRWISFGHVESDECGSMNLWLQAAPNAQIVHGRLGCDVSLNDLADRAPHPLGDGESLDIGGRRMRWLDTPHVPHGWEAGAFFDEDNAILFCGDLFTHAGRGPALTNSEVVEPAAQTERMFRAMTMAPGTRTQLERLAALNATTLALMHGSSFEGDGAAALRGLADFCEAEANSRR